MQILSSSNPSQHVPADQQIELTRQANDRLAESVRANPTRFGGFACLPWGHPEAAAEELERAVKELGFVGTLLIGRPGDIFLDDPRYDPILAKLNELRVPIYLHPGMPLPQVQQPYYGGLATQVSARLSLFGWGWHNEAGVHLLRLLLSRKFDEYPNLQVISGHWGEIVPLLSQQTGRRDSTGCHRSLPLHHGDLQAACLCHPQRHHGSPSVGTYSQGRRSGPHPVLRGLPYLTLAGARRFLESLSVSQEDKEKMAHGNAEILFHL